MALDDCFRRLRLSLERLRESLDGLRMGVAEDRPLHDDAVLVDMLDDTVEDLRGYAQGALTAAMDAQHALDSDEDMRRIRRALAECQTGFGRLAHGYAAGLVSYERVAALRRIARERGGEWREWSRSVRQGIESCREPLYEVEEALFHCWQELAEHAGAVVSVQATNIGQQISVPDGVAVPTERPTERRPVA
jgi:hypothetical protein